MKKFILPTLTTLAIPVTANAGVDFTDVVKTNAMLILFLLTAVGTVAAWAGQKFLDSKEKKLEHANQVAEEKEKEAFQAGMKLQEREIQNLKASNASLTRELDKVLQEHITCQKELPAKYVTRQEFERFQTQHREDINSIALRMETMIKDFRNELKSDMQDQIDRIINVINEVMKR